MLRKAKDSNFFDNYSISPTSYSGLIYLMINLVAKKSHFFPQLHDAKWILFNSVFISSKLNLLITFLT